MSVTTIQIRRGAESGLPVGASGEPLWTTDTLKLFVSNGTDDIPVSIDRLAKTANYTVVAKDKNRIIDCTANTFTVTLTAAATLKSGFFVAVYNSGSGVITVDANASETIRVPGGTPLTLTLNQGECCGLVCDGTNWIRIFSEGGQSSAVGSSSKIDIFTPGGSYTWTKAAGALFVQGFLYAGGGGGGSGRRGATNTVRGGGGGGGGGGFDWFPAVAASAFGSTETVTVGLGGGGGAAVSADNTSGNNGTDGTASSVGSVLANNTGGKKGSGGGAGVGAKGLGGAGSYAAGGNGSDGGAGNAGGSVGAGSPSNGCGGGAGGGGIDTINGAQNGGIGGTGDGGFSGLGVAGTAGLNAGPVAAGNGGNGSPQINYFYEGGGGGGGGYSLNAGVGGTGGNGGQWGAGGGGGGASLNGNNSGAGGGGKDGIVITIQS